jgi:nitrogen fixation protein FixH
MVYRMSRQRVDLVSDNYYQNEIDFQQHIDQTRNVRLTSPASLQYEPARQRLVVDIPGTLQTGRLTFYRPGDRRQDFTVPLINGRSLRQIVSTRGMGRGNWRIQVTWSDGIRAYYQEEKLAL